MILNVLEEADEVTLVRESRNDKRRKVLVGGQEKKPGTGFDSALNDFLPKDCRGKIRSRITAQNNPKTVLRSA